MAWRSIIIQHPARLNLQKRQLQCENEAGKTTLPLEDISVILLESPQISLTSALLAQCQESGVAVVTCDEKHIPNGVLLPFMAHSRQSKIAHLQISWSEPLKKRLWQRVVQCKIRNQAACLAYHKGAEVAVFLEAMERRVASGDSDNLEAQAARYYWQKLFGSDFRRGGNDSINAALNYGYAVVRAFVARSQVGYGLLPAFGIHHDNDLNAFNLTDDMMEVFRPMVDNLVMTLVKQEEINPQDFILTQKNRQQLVNISNDLCQFAGQMHTIANACEKIAASVVNAIEGKSAALLQLPEFILQKDLPE